ncbi:MAG: amino acid decarboxylase [Saprospiraceae bacterium]|nr:amino acid decarboxylase [Saprospiraceae bacterium]
MTQDDKLPLLEQELAALEPEARLLEPDARQRAEWMAQLQRETDAFIGGLEGGKAYRKAGPMGGVLESLRQIPGPVPLDEVLAELREGMLNRGLNPASGGHLAYIPGGGIFAGAMGDFLAAVYNQYAGVYYGGPGAVKIENELLRWLCRMMAYPAGSLGNLTSGGSVANLIALVTAREAHGLQAADLSQSCIYLTAQVHHCVHKAIRIAGLSSVRIRTIPTDSHFRMDPEALQTQVAQDRATGFHPFLAVASAGTTDTGSIDPMDAIADCCGSNGMWFHVDAAYGGFFALSRLSYPNGKMVRDAYRGISRSDSVAIDPHKGLFLPYGLGAVLIRDVASQYKAHYYRAAYMQDAFAAQEELSPADLSPEMTKHFRGLRLWLPLRLYGLAPFVANLDEKILLCRYFYHRVQAMGFVTGPYPDTSICIFRWAPPGQDADAATQALLDRVVDDGRVFLSSTTLDGQFWIRLAVLSFRTHLSTIKTCLDVLQNALTCSKI